MSCLTGLDAASQIASVGSGELARLHGGSRVRHTQGDSIMVIGPP
jgi:hypothetical protein